jgi:hypothetical protein
LKFFAAASIAMFLLTACASAGYQYVTNPHEPVPDQPDTYTFGVYFSQTGSDNPIVDAEANKIADENMKKLSFTSYKIIDRKCPQANLCVYVVKYAR